MAKGRPDWTSSINITGQDLAEVIERPKYGGAQYASYGGEIVEDSDDIIFSISGTGMIYGGIIYHSGAFDPDKVGNQPAIDEATMAYLSIEQLNIRQIEDKNMWFLFEQYYSEENDKYIQGIVRDITFETDYSIKIWNHAGSGAGDIVQASLMYALI